MVVCGYRTCDTATNRGQLDLGALSGRLGDRNSIGAMAKTTGAWQNRMCYTIIIYNDFAGAAACLYGTKLAGWEQRSCGTIDFDGIGRMVLPTWPVGSGSGWSGAVLGCVRFVFRGMYIGSEECKN